MTAYSLSFADLMLVDDFKTAIKRDDTTTVQRVLFENGMEVSKHYEIRICNHRTLSNREFNGPRFEGEERLDSVWVKSGCASMDAIIESAKDPSVRFELRVMSKQVQQDRAWEQGE